MSGSGSPNAGKKDPDPSKPPPRFSAVLQAMPSAGWAADRHLGNSGTAKGCVDQVRTIAGRHMPSRMALRVGMFQKVVKSLRWRDGRSRQRSNACRATSISRFSFDDGHIRNRLHRLQQGGHASYLVPGTRILDPALRRINSRTYGNCLCICRLQSCEARRRGLGSNQRPSRPWPSDLRANQFHAGMTRRPDSVASAQKYEAQSRYRRCPDEG